MEKKYFGTDGIRGIANTTLTAEFIMKLGKCLSAFLNKKNAKVLIGKDTRVSGDMIENALTSGLCSSGVDVVKVGILTSAGTSYLTQKYAFDLGIEITSSHNPPEYNGIKIFDSNGFKLSDKQEKEIEKLLNRDNTQETKEIGKVVFLPNMKNDYVDFLISCALCRLEGKHYVIDCANGAGSFFANTVFSRLGATVECINCGNGEKINLDCGATCPQTLSNYVKNHPCDLGFSLDGDADRLIVCDKFGTVLDGDDLLCLLALNMQKNNQLMGNTVVGTVMNNFGLERELQKHNIKLIRTDVGDKNVIECLANHNYSLGGEQSGHTVFYKQLNSADAILSAINIAMLEASENISIDKLINNITKYPQVKLNIVVPENAKERISSHPKLKEYCEQIQQEMMDSGRIVVRASGTEPLIRVMVEGEDKNYVHDTAEKVKAFVLSLI